MSIPRRKPLPSRQDKHHTAPRPERRTDTKALKERIGDQWLDLLRTLAPDLEEACDDFPEHVACPMHGGRDGFRLFDDAEETGGGVCNTCGSFSDGIALLQAVNDWTFSKTLRKIQDYLDDNLDDEEERMPLPTSKRTRAADEESSQWAADYIVRVIDQAVSGDERIAAYYRYRGLSVEPSGNLAYIENEDYYDQVTGRLTLPVMLGIFQDLQGTPVAVFRTYLDPDSDGKALVPTPKKSTPAIRKGATMGAAIRLREPVGDVLGFAEGIETAEAVFQSTGTPTWATCAANRLEKVAIPEGIREVQVWGDHDASGVGQKAAMKLAARLVAQGVVAKVILPPEVDTDWLDVLVQHGEGALRQAAASAHAYDPSLPVRTPNSTETQPPPTASVFGTSPMRTGNPVTELNKRHFVVQVGGKTYVATESRDPDTGYLRMELGGVRDLELLYSNWIVAIDEKSIPASKVWLTSSERREYERIDFLPGREVPNIYNMWKGFAVEPRQGDCSLFWQHLRSGICAGDETHYRYVRKWLAHLVQNPAELPEVAIVIRGSEGVGKNLFADIVGDLLGPHYLMLTKMDQLTGRFTGHFKDTLLICANEAVWVGDKQGEGSLKSMITDKKCAVEQKGKDLFQVNNYKRLIVTTNEEWAVPMSMKDRRFLVLQPSDEHREDKVYFAALIKQVKEGGLQALLYDLLHESLEGFDVRSKPPSRHGFYIQLRSADAVVRWWYECLHKGYHGCPPADDLDDSDWNQEPQKDALHRSFLEYCTTHRQRTIGSPIFGKELHKMLVGSPFRETRPRSSAGERNRCYGLPTLHECREAFQRFAKAGAEIWAEVEGDEA